MGGITQGRWWKPPPWSFNLPPNPEWQWLRSHVVGAWLLNHQAGRAAFNAGLGQRVGTLTAPAAGDGYRTVPQWGPVLALVGTAGYLHTGWDGAGGVDLMAAAGQAWTLLVRYRTSATAVNQTIVSRTATATVANRAFQVGHGTAAGAQPFVNLRGTQTNTSWGWDDGSIHTMYVTWDGAVGTAYQDFGRSAVALGVGTAADEGQPFLLGARNAAAPAGFWNGDIHAVVILDVALSPPDMQIWQRDIYAPFRPARRRTGRGPSPVPVIVAQAVNRAATF